jgi:hypothetical protein
MDKVNNGDMELTLDGNGELAPGMVDIEQERAQLRARVLARLRSSFDNWSGDSEVRQGPSLKHVTPLDVYRQIFGHEMPENVTATWDGTLVTFEVGPIVEPFELSSAFVTVGSLRGWNTCGDGPDCSPVN